MDESNIIPTSDLESEFESFLNIESNSRIFFSGKFGIGKTFLLKNFFEQRLENFDFYHLFPVNYQINSNEDIIELLKYDLLCELLKKDKNIFRERKVQGVRENVFLFYSWIKERYSINRFLQSTISLGEGLAEISPDPTTQLFGKLGKPLKDLLEVSKEFEEFKEEYKDLGESAVAEKYLKEVKNVAEDDYMSHLITEKVKALKQGRKSVLILDDLDRLDPEHIFRVLNIFSAHFKDEDNKFGFDILILVGDMKNIQSIFHHKYGEEADFEGYFNKFFTVKPYILDNKNIISQRIPYILEQIKCDESNLKGAIGKSGYLKILLSEILIQSLHNNSLNLRQLLKPRDYSFIELRKGVFTPDGFEDDFQKILDIGIKLLIAIFGGDSTSLVKVLEKIKSNISTPNEGMSNLYNRYSASLLKSIIQLKEGQGYWDNKTTSYSFILTPSNRGGYSLEIEESKKAQLFYDALIEYIRTSKFIKRGHWDYDN